MSDAQPNPIVYFLDRTHGKLIRDLLVRVGLQVRTHRTMAWSDDKPDPEWIAECSNFRWVIISGDKAIESVPEERQAVINGRCKVFMFDDTHATRTEDWAASFIVARERIAEIINKADGPFFVTIKPCKVRGHVGTPRFVEKAGGGWRSPESSPEPPPSAAPTPEARQAKPQQTGLFDSVLVPKG